MAEKTFAAGAYWKEPREGAPEYVIGSLSIKVQDFKPFLDAHIKNNGYVDLDVFRGQSGKPYIALNTWVPDKEAPIKHKEEIDPKSIPF